MSCLEEHIDLRHGLMAVPINAALFVLKDNAPHRRSESAACSVDMEMGQGESDGVAVALRRIHFAKRGRATYATLEDSEQTCVVNGEFVPAQVRHVHHRCIAILATQCYTTS